MFQVLGVYCCALSVCAYALMLAYVQCRGACEEGGVGGTVQNEVVCASLRFSIVQSVLD